MFSYFFVSHFGVLIFWGHLVTGFMSITGELLYASRSCTVRMFFSMFSSLQVVSAILLGLLGVLVANAPINGRSRFPVGWIRVWKLLVISWSWNITSIWLYSSSLYNASWNAGSIMICDVVSLHWLWFLLPSLFLTMPIGCTGIVNILLIFFTRFCYYVSVVS